MASVASPLHQAAPFCCQMLFWLIAKSTKKWMLPRIELKIRIVFRVYYVADITAEPTVVWLA